jgi:hypothetical protein
VERRFCVDACGRSTYEKSRIVVRVTAPLLIILRRYEPRPWKANCLGALQIGVPGSKIWRIWSVFGVFGLGPPEGIPYLWDCHSRSALANWAGGVQSVPPNSFLATGLESNQEPASAPGEISIILARLSIERQSLPLPMIFSSNRNRPSPSGWAAFSKRQQLPHSLVLRS